VIDHSQDDLAKFGYRSKSKVVEFFGNSIGSMYQQHARTYGLNLDISTLVFFLKIWRHSRIVSPQKNPSPFFCGQVGANSATKKDKPWHAQSLRNTKLRNSSHREAQKMLKQKYIVF
jgi:hypothetical protein